MISYTASARWILAAHFCDHRICCNVKCVDTVKLDCGCWDNSFSNIQFKWLRVLPNHPISTPIYMVIWPMLTYLLVFFWSCYLIFVCILAIHLIGAIWVKFISKIVSKHYILISSYEQILVKHLTKNHHRWTQPNDEYLLFLLSVV